MLYLQLTLRLKPVVLITVQVAWEGADPIVIRILSLRSCCS